MASCSAALKQSWIWPLWIWRLYNTKKCQGLCYRHVTLSQCYGQLITTFSLILMGAGSDTKSKNPPKKIVLNEVQPVSLNIIHPWVFPICWFWPINCLFVYFYLILFAYLWLPLRKKKKKGWEVQQCHQRLWDGAHGNDPFNRFFLRHSAKVCSPSTKCENDVCITKTFSQRGWTVIWNKLIFSWEGSKSLEVLFF